MEDSSIKEWLFERRCAGKTDPTKQDLIEFGYDPQHADELASAIKRLAPQTPWPTQENYWD